MGKNTYAVYKNTVIKPKGYYRYQSNISDPTQERLPIDLPDPNEDDVDFIKKLEFCESMQLLKNGYQTRRYKKSLRQLNYCQ